jgi:hypothetical protein
MASAKNELIRVSVAGRTETIIGTSLSMVCIGGSARMIA